MRVRVVRLSEILQHGGILSPDHYIPNPEPVRERIAVLEERRRRLDEELEREKQHLTRLERGETCTDPRHVR
jgi:hypothetical protein